MNRLIFEGRLLVNIAGSIIRQDDLRPVHGRLDWERMYRTADYHKIAAITYLGLLGNGERVSPRWQELFFDRYQEALRYSDICAEAEREILILLDMMEMPCIVLASCGMRDLYQVPEMAAKSPLRLYFAPENYTLAKGFLVDLGYETEWFFPESGERMKRISGFVVEIYHKLPYKTKLYQKQVSRLLEHAYIKSSFNYVRTLSLEGRFILRVVEAAYHYATDELTVRELMDIHLYYKVWREEMNEEQILRTLQAFRVDVLGMKLIQLSRMWFGSKDDVVFGVPSEDMEVYDVLENRILSRGMLKREIDAQALQIAQQIEREENKERRKKKREMIKEQLQGFWSTHSKKLRWVFPEYKYMCTLYPVLEKIPVLLPIFWSMRIVRMLVGMILDKIKRS